jgi:hypothetical protein
MFDIYFVLRFNKHRLNDIINKPHDHLNRTGGRGIRRTKNVLVSLLPYLPQGNAEFKPQKISFKAQMVSS